MSSETVKHRLIYKAQFSDGTYHNATIESNASDLSELLVEIECYLMACGYSVKEGSLTVREEE